MKPLEGLFVLDFSTLLPGPLATLLLAEVGAEVVKIERPRCGEEMRGRTPKWGNDSASFALLNRGKRSVALDLKNPAERARLQPLVERADVIVEQFRPGVMARLGLDYDRRAPSAVIERKMLPRWGTETLGESGKSCDDPVSVPVF
jgi:alpha-methylacyl-CoA racemase